MLQYAPVCWRFVLARFGGRLCCHQSQHQSLLPSELELGEWVMLIRQPRWPRRLGWPGQPRWPGWQVVSKWCYLSTKMPKWSAQHLLLEQCPRMGVLLEQCPSGQHSSAVGAVVGMSTMIPNMCPPYVQHAATAVSTKVGQVGQVIPKMMYHQCPPRCPRRPRCQVVSKLVKYQIQCGKYEDQVGQQQKQGIQTDVREIKEGFKLPC